MKIMIIQRHNIIIIKQLLIIAFLLLGTVSQAGTVANIGVEGPLRPIQINSLQAEAADYWTRYSDVRNDPYYGASPEHAREHFDTWGRNEGRTWNILHDIGILTFCGDRGIGGSGNGYNCIHFPDGARIGGVAWESSVKVGNSEVLSILNTSNGHTLVVTYQQGQSHRIKVVNFPEPIDLPAGGFVWIYAEGWGDSSSGGFEAQVQIFLLGTPRWSP